MNISIKFPATLIFTLVTALSLNAQTFPSLLIGADANGYASGAATVSKAEGAFAVDNNVAFMSLSSCRLDAAVSYGIWQPEYADNGIVNAGVACRVFKGLALGISFRDRLQSPYDITTSTGAASRDGSYTPKEYNIALGASYAVLPYLSAGISLRYLRSDLSPEAGSSAFATDIAVAYSRIFGQHGVNAGASVNSLGTRLKYGEGKYSLPSQVRLGAAYSFYFCQSAASSSKLSSHPCHGTPFRKSEPSSLSISAELDALFSGAVMAGAGLEYSFRNSLYVRAGYHYGDRSKAVPSYASVGLGLSFFGVSVNASYIFASEILRNSFGVSLGYSF